MLETKEHHEARIKEMNEVIVSCDGKQKGMGDMGIKIESYLEEELKSEKNF